jgi:small subunit ribosomal protein S3Ae
MSKSAKKATTKLKKKEWFQILAPKSFNSALIGETLASEASELMGRPVSVNLMVITNNFKHQNINVTFIVDNISGDKATTQAHGCELMTASVKRLIRRRREHIFDSFVVETKEKKSVTFKPLLITRGAATNSVVTKIRLTARNFIANYASKNDFDTLFRDVAFGKLQKMLSDRIKKICPLRSCDIRVFKLEEKRKPTVVAKDDEPEQKPEEAEEDFEEKPKKKKEAAASANEEDIPYPQEEAPGAEEENTVEHPLEE